MGSTGFIGRRILEALQVRQDLTLSILTRRPTGWMLGRTGPEILGDITSPSAVEEAVKGSDVVINAASYVGSDSEAAERINVQGAFSVINACERYGIRRLIQLSTTAVYGSGPHRNLEAEAAEYAPESVISRTRARADGAVLAAGGIVVRPSLVYGPGDRWFIPGLIRMFRTLGSTINNGSAKLSLIDVTDLGKLIAALATTTAAASAGAYHAADPHPVTLERLLSFVSRKIRPIALTGSCSGEEAVRQLSLQGFSSHQVNMLAIDHYYEAEYLWQMADINPGGLASASPETLDWYRRHCSD